MQPRPDNQTLRGSAARAELAVGGQRAVKHEIEPATDMQSRDVEPNVRQGSLRRNGLKYGRLCRAAFDRETDKSMISDAWHCI
jgi:hypothetical protein